VSEQKDLRPRGGRGVHALHQDLAEATEGLRDQLLQSLSRWDVETVEGIVKHQELWARRERPDKQHLLDFTARDGGDGSVQDRVQPEADDQIAGGWPQRAKGAVNSAAVGEELLVRFEGHASHSLTRRHRPTMQ